MDVQAYPLQWPIARPRKSASQRRRAKFARKVSVPGQSWSRSQDLSVADAIERLDTEVVKLTGRRNFIISSNVEVRLDGLPYSNRKAPTDPAVAVYFKLGSDDICMPCDTFDRVADNIAAVAAHIEATRKIERNGVASVAEMFTGFSALPSPDHKKNWREVLGVKPDGNPSPERLKERYRELSKTRHPDSATGSDEKFKELTQAYQDAKMALHS